MQRRIRAIPLATGHAEPVETRNKQHFREIPALTAEKQAEFWALVDRRGPNECWPWRGRTTLGAGRQPYGVFGRESFRPHRIAYTLLVGRIPLTHTLDHLRGSVVCTTTLCCNPAHLEPVTPAENTRRYRASLPRVCQRGHEMAPTGYCQACIKMKTAEWVDANREHLKASRREWYARNRERIRAQRRATADCAAQAEEEVNPQSAQGQTSRRDSRGIELRTVRNARGDFEQGTD